MVKTLTYYLNLVLTKVVEWIWNRASAKSSIEGVCLVFHHISPIPLQTLDCCQCTPSTFVSIIERLQESGYVIISMDELQHVMAQQAPKKFALITFDDVPGDMYENAYPYLTEKKIPFTVFVTTSYIDKEGYITLSQLQDLNRNPFCTIGAHTISHPLLRFHPDKLKEIVDGGNELERLINKRIDYFAYPFGSLYSVDIGSIRLAKQRYMYSFSTIHSNLNDFTIRRKNFLPRKAISDISELNLNPRS